MMGGFTSLIVLHLACLCKCMDQLDVVYEWKQIDYQFPTPEARLQALENMTFIPENNIPMGLEAYGDRLFITVPRWRHGVASTLNYIDLRDNSTTSPKLIPYPSWESHSLDETGKPKDIVSPFRIRADRCGRLWILDSGTIGSVVANNITRYPPSLIVFDLDSDKLIRKYEFPKEQVKEESIFGNIAVEDTDCDNTFVYASDIRATAVVYSWAKNESWKITHNYFHLDPMACDYSVKGINFTWTDGLFGLGISAPNADNFSTLYFHPMSSFNEFAVSTEYMRNESVAKANFNAFKLLGGRGPNAQSSVSFVDPKTGVLFYSLVNLNAVACWRTTNKGYNMKNQGRIYMNNEVMVFPSDIKVDYNHSIWILSNRLPIWMYGKLDSNDVNFRVFSAPVLRAISHTACDITPRTDILEKFVKSMNGTKKPNSSITIIPLSFLTMSVISWLIPLIIFI